MDLLNLAKVVEKQNSIDAIWDSLKNGLKNHDIDHLIYITVDQNFENPCLLTTLPRLFVAESPVEDPFLHWCCDSYAPTLTGSEFLSEHDYLPIKARNFIKRAGEEGFKSGIGIPVRLVGADRFGGFNLGTGLLRDQFKARILDKADDLRLVCHLAHRRICELTRAIVLDDTGLRTQMIAPPDPHERLHLLTPREREVLYLIARGLSRKECAQMCQISVNTVSEYAKKAYSKLGLRNRAEAATLFAARDQFKE